MRVYAHTYSLNNELSIFRYIYNDWFSKLVIQTLAAATTTGKLLINGKHYTIHCATRQIAPNNTKHSLSLSLRVIKKKNLIFHTHRSSITQHAQRENQTLRGRNLRAKTHTCGERATHCNNDCSATEKNKADETIYKI